MKILIKKLADGVSKFPDSAETRLAREFLLSGSCRLIGRGIFETSVDYILDVWKLRYKRSISRGVQLHGAEDLLEKLERANRESLVRIHAIFNTGEHGLFFISMEDDRLIGWIVHKSNDDSRVVL